MPTINQATALKAWESRPDLQATFYSPASGGYAKDQSKTPGWNIYKWAEQYGVKEMPDIFNPTTQNNNQPVNTQTNIIQPTNTQNNVAQKPYIRNPESNDVYDRQGNWIDETKASQIPEFWNQVEVTNTAPNTSKWNEPVAITYDTGNEDLNNMLTSINDVLTSITNSGKIVNPNIDITPELTQQWLDQSSTELDPYYKSQFDAIKDDLSTDLTFLSDQYKQTQKANEATFKANLETQRESESGAGTIFSGGRLSREEELAQGAERNMESLGSTMGYQARKAGTSAERTIGSGGLAGLTSPTYSSYKVSTKGQGGYIPLGERSLFSPTGNITGSLEREKIEKKRDYSDLLKSYWLSEQNV
jgi:hypothetical protein